MSGRIQIYTDGSSIGNLAQGLWYHYGMGGKGLC